MSDPTFTSSATTEHDDRTCPDGGRCHHQCSMTACFRVAACEPLSGVYDGDVWPERVLLALGGTDSGREGP